MPQTARLRDGNAFTDSVENPTGYICTMPEEIEQVLRDPHPLLWDARLRAADVDIVAKTNAAALRLSDGRAVEINAAGPYLKSKIAWKLAVYSYGLQHRLVNLADGIAICWNAQNTLGAFLNARALIETVAVVCHFEETLCRDFRNRDLTAINAFVDNGTFATRDPELVAFSPGIEARNILTSINKLDKGLPGVRAHYDRLSERCHPNAMGHVRMYSELNREDASVNFRGELHAEANAAAVLSAYAILALGESRLQSLHDLTLQVSDLQHLQDPVLSE
ncbi:hypothetical protein [Rhizobium leguminosarum]|uniref:hypothetical protein n=1 Tax=Rhizobium leguminosarum TaxID=384 RepID=UPI001C9590B5|nr:hypothetical protein [Rhizobium leguminosarum]MBY5416204.1 hypothetical protein [Rhizobium leguminosarum]